MTRAPRIPHDHLSPPRLHKRHVYVKASIFVSCKIDRVVCTILPQVRHKFNRYYLPYRYFTLAPFTPWYCKKSLCIARMIQVHVTFSCLSFDLSPHFRKPVAIVQTNRFRSTLYLGYLWILAWLLQVSKSKNMKCALLVITSPKVLNSRVADRFSFAELLARERTDKLSTVASRSTFRHACPCARAVTRAHARRAHCRYVA